MTNVKEKEKSDLPPFMSERKKKEREVLFRPMVPCIVVQILPPTWAVQRISNYGCTGHGILLHAPLFIIISAHIYMYMCVCMCAAKATAA